MAQGPHLAQSPCFAARQAADFSWKSFALHWWRKKLCPVIQQSKEEKSKKTYSRSSSQQLLEYGFTSQIFIAFSFSKFFLIDMPGQKCWCHGLSVLVSQHSCLTSLQGDFWPLGQGTCPGVPKTGGR